MFVGHNARGGQIKNKINDNKNGLPFVNYFLLYVHFKIHYLTKEVLKYIYFKSQIKKMNNISFENNSFSW